MALEKDTPKKRKQKPQPLTAKQENFAVAYIMNGRDASAAYREAYDVGENTKPTTIWVEGHKILKSSKVSLRVHELSMQTIGCKVMSIEERKELLTKQSVEGCTKSMDMLNRMDGAYEKDNRSKVETTIKYESMDDFYKDNT